MGKRSNFERRPRDFYPTPRDVAFKLSPWLKPPFTFVEPCVGQHDLVRHLTEMGGKCMWYSDLPVDARDISEIAVLGADYIITNPPWPQDKNGDPTKSIIEACMKLRMSWFLLAADFMHNKYFGSIETHCRRIVSVGRVKWIPGTQHVALDNAAWYLFSERHTGGPKFHNMEHDQ